MTNLEHNNSNSNEPALLTALKWFLGSALLGTGMVLTYSVYTGKDIDFELSKDKTKLITKK